jgi:hypothetical protein
MQIISKKDKRKKKKKKKGNNKTSSPSTSAFHVELNNQNLSFLRRKLDASVEFGNLRTVTFVATIDMEEEGAD